MHQQWHLALTIDDAPSKYDVVVQLPLPNARIAPLAAWAKLVYRRVGAAVPYNFVIPNEVFDLATGQLLLKRGEGLTCSTFVIALLEAAGIQILRRDDWPSRPDDVSRHQQLVRDLRSRLLDKNGELSDAHEEHLAYMNHQALRAVRFRPEETAAAASILPKPANFADVEVAASELLQAYTAKFGG